METIKPTPTKPYRENFAKRCHSSNERIDQCIVYGKPGFYGVRHSPWPLGKLGPCQTILEARAAGRVTFEDRSRPVI